MSARSILTVSAALAAVSVVVAGVWLSHGFRSGADRDRRPSSAAQPAPEGQSVRTVYPGPLSGPAQRISPPPQNEPAATIPAAAAPTVASSSVAPTAGSVPPELTPPENQGGSTPTVATPESKAPSSSRPPASAGPTVDLNTASVEELNVLGAGMIGRRIIAFRPYASPEDLLTKRVLKRADYEAIKAAVTVR